MTEGKLEEGGYRTWSEEFHCVKFVNIMNTLAINNNLIILSLIHSLPIQSIYKIKEQLVANLPTEKSHIVQIDIFQL